ncbi:MAG: hypothetical protein ACREBG_31095, partial [Pyrinomonadaceae bacterium]
RRIVGLRQPLEKILVCGREEIVLQVDRNLNYQALLSENTLDNVPPPLEPVAEYTLPSGAYGYVTHAMFDERACREFVHESVADFVDSYHHVLVASSSLVVGVSGGGDSNALLTTLVNVTRGLGIAIVPVMILGVPEWDSAVDRAQELSASVGLELQVIGSRTVNEILGRPSSVPNWLSDFHAHFPREDSDVIGTLAIRLALSSLARRIGASCVVTGLNLEDLLAECFLRLIQGRHPLQFPVRALDGINFCYPVYRVPKKILDGCHPKHSLANYEERSAGVMMGRAIPYHLAQSVNSIVPGAEFDLLEGFRSLPHERPNDSTDFGFATLVDAGMSPEVESRWAKYISGERPDDPRTAI